MSPKPRVTRGAKAATVTSPARIQFLADWRTVQDGNILAGGKVIVDYDPQRLVAWRREWRDAVIWHIDAIARFQPGGEAHTESVLEPIRAGADGPIRDYAPRPVALDVPPDAACLELWFHASLADIGGGEGWDSRYGQNYEFDVVQGS
jgi:hypothetical protein